MLVRGFVDVVVVVVVVLSGAFLLFVDIVRPTVGLVPAPVTAVGFVSGFGLAAPVEGSVFLDAAVDESLEIVVLARGLGDLLNDLVPLEAIVDGFGVMVGARPVRPAVELSLSALGLKLENAFDVFVVSDLVGATLAMGALPTADGRM